MKHKKMNLLFITLVAALFLASLVVGIAGNASPVQAAEGEDFWGWRMADRALGYPDWTGDWDKGNLQKEWREGDWVSYIFVLNGYGGASLPAGFKIRYDFLQASSGGILVDLVRNFSYKIRAPYGGSGIPTDVTPANFETWRDNTFTPSEINVPCTGDGTPVTPDDELAPENFAYFTLDSGEFGTIPTGQSLVIYFELHLARTFVWMNGLEAGYNSAPYNAWGGTRYAGWTTDGWLGSGFVSGSSGHANEIGGGAKTVPIPIPPQPAGLIDGYKFEDLDGDGLPREAGEPGIEGWRIYIAGEDPDGLLLTDSILTDATGFYSFPVLTAGTWYIAEDVVREVPAETFWSQTYPNDMSALVPPVALPIATSVIPFAFPGSPALADWGYQVDLTEIDIEQHNVDFGNVGTGSLEITKEVDFSGIIGDPADVPDVDFTVTVTGPSYPTGTDLIFHLVDGVVTYDAEMDATACLSGLIPGDYYVTEIVPMGWEDAVITNDDPATVAAGDACGDTAIEVIVTNEPTPGSLEVTKEVDFSGIVGDPADVLDVDFTVTVTGPSYPSGTDLTFHLVDGVVNYDAEMDATACLSGLIPGDYYVTEIAPMDWEDAVITNDDPAAVAAGDACGDTAIEVIVTNEPTPGCLEVTKEVDFSGIIGDPADVPDVDFTITVTGPSYPSGIDLIFHLIDGVVTYDAEMDATACLCGLMPGDYNVTETPPAGWIITGEGENEDQLAVVVAGTECGVDAIEVVVPNAPTPGCLEITKEIDFSGIIGDPADVPDVDFTVTVTGPSYPSGTDLVFHLVDGVVTYDAEMDANACLCGLIPGDYYVTEIAPADWEDAVITNDDPAVVAAGAACSGEAIEVIVTNEPTPGCLEVTKEIAAGSMAGALADVPDVDFTVTVTGPSYPTGHDLTFHLVDGVVNYDAEMDATACLCGLIPGDYYVTEIAPAGWADAVITNDDPAAVAAGDACGDTAIEVIVTNSPGLGCLEVTKEVDFSGIIGDPADVPDVDFTVTVTGPSYPSGTDLIFHLVNGVVNYDAEMDDTACLCDLIPGDYYVTEIAPADWEDAVITNDDPATVAAGDACGDTAIEVIVTNEPTPGCLEVTKEVDFSGIIGDPADVPDVDFTVTVTGPSYPSGTDLIFHLVNGVVNYDAEMDATACLCDLIPGDYYVTEIAPADWEDAVITNDDPATVAAGDACGDTAIEVIVTNEPTPGCLEVTKEVDFSGIIGDPADVPDVDFTVTVTGPSYPSGTDLIFHLVNGVVNYDAEMDDTACLCDLIPGDYYVTEIAPADWEDAVITNDDPATVAAGDACGDTAIEVIVTNEPTPGCLEVTKEVDFSGIIGDPADVPDVDFTVTVTGPSYPSGTDLIFHLVNGVVNYDAEMDATACLCDLIPGDYYVTEIAPADWEDAVITNDDPATVAAGDACGDTAIEVIVTNEPTPGCLEVTKEVDFSGIIGDPADVPDVDFTVTVTGPSYPSGTDLIFHLVNGVVNYDAEMDDTACLCDLIPGDYYVTEIAPADWEDAVITNDDPATVAAGDACGDTAIEVIVTNEPTPGCLEVTKEVDFSGIIGDPADVPDVDFTVTVTGPSYPSGTDLIFHLVNGVVNYDAEMDDTACLCDLIPGDYYVTEIAPADWEDAVITNDDPATVAAGDACGDTAIEVIVTNEPTPGCLEVTKEVDFSGIIGDPADVPDVDFTVTVTGPSYPSGTDLIFHLVNGVVNYDAEMDATACLCDLIPGDYYVTEIAPADWEDAVITNDDPAAVAAGDACGDTAIEVIVTNEPTPGCLEVTKEVDFSGIIGDPADVPDVDFTVTVTGPSYPSGTDLIFHLVNGVVNYDAEMDATACLCDLIPGDYYVTEIAPADWEDAVITNDDPATVAAGDACGDTAIEVIVTNEPTPGCLEVTKEVDFSGIIGDPADVPDVDFTVTVTGPSYPSGTDLIFHLVNGVVNYDAEMDATACLCDLIPGDYYVTEIAPADWEDAVITNDDPATVAAGDACGDTAIEVIVTNEPTPGCLEVTKEVDFSGIIGDPADVPDVDFTVTVTGPSYPSGTDLIFHLVNGVVNYDAEMDATACLCDLIPGDYYVTEIAPAGWADAVITNDDPAAVAAGDACGDTAIEVIVTNEPTPGCLEVTKEVDFSGIIGDPADVPDVDFTVTVTGPSYPSGTDLIFHLVNGVVNYDAEMDATACLCDLIPGDYYVTEIAPADWEDAVITNDDPATVAAGDACGDTAIEVIVTNEPTPGCLEVTKEVDFSGIIGDPADVPDVDFTVTVTGPSYPSGTDLIFHLVNGVVNYDAEMDATACLCDLIPGDYYVTEIAPADWEDAVITNDDPATVAAGDACGDTAIEVIVTNEPTPGCLEVTKEVDFSGIIGDPADVPDVDFTVTVTGPSYPSGTDLIFHLVNGVVNYDAEMDATACLCDLIPGDYYVTEIAPADWEDAVITNDDPATVAAGDACGDTAIEVIVTNEPTPGCLEVTKEVDFSGIIGDPADVPDVDFTVTVTGPSYPSGTDLIFHLVNGVVNYDAEMDDTACLCDLIPGDYYVTEIAPADWEDAVITNDDPATVAAGDACGDTAIEVIVTNEPTPGCLEVTKEVDFSGIIGDPADVPDVDFTVTVTGPSYPSGTDLIFHLVNGVVNYDAEMDATACLCDLIPGDYYVTEIAPADWEDAVITNDDPATVAAGDACGDTAIEVIVTNEPTPGCLEVRKVVDLDDYMYASSANSTFIITVTGPSYPSGTDLIFHLVNGVVNYDAEMDDTACLCNLIPGNYTATETAPAGWDDPIIVGSPALVEAGDECDDGAALITVTNTLLIPHTTMLEITYVYDSVSGNVTMNITDCNDGEVPLTDAEVYLRANNITYGFSPMDHTSPYFAGGDTNLNPGDSAGVLDPGECWTWVVNVTISGTTFFEAWGDGIDPLGNHVTYNPDTGEGYESEYQSFEVGLCWGDETAWAYGGQYAKENWDYANGNNWGWTNGLLSEGSYVWDVYAGAGQNILSKGTVVGTVSVNYAGGCVNVTYNVDEGYYLGETHLWVGNDVLPKVTKGKKSVYTDAPGQFPYGVDYGFDPADPGTWETEWSWSGCGFSGDIYVAAHGVVWMEVECPEEPMV